jgi:putative resolvase
MGGAMAHFERSASALLDAKKPIDSENFISTGKASNILGISKQQIRDWIKSGELIAYRTAGNHFRINKTHVMQLINGAKKGSEGKKVIIYARVSTRHQIDNLKRQVSQLKEYAQQNYAGLPIIVFQECGSGFNEGRPQLNNLINSILSGEFTNCILLASFKDRISRFNAGFVEIICRFHNIEIVYTEQEGATDEEMAKSDLLAFLNYWMARSYGGRQKRAKPLSDEIINRGAELLKAGVAAEKIPALIEKEGLGKISYWQVRKYVYRNKDTLIPFVKYQNSADEFRKEFVMRAPDTTRTNSDGVYQFYLKWCKDKIKLAITKRMFLRSFRDTRVTRLCFVGISIKGAPKLSKIVRKIESTEVSGPVDCFLTWIGQFRGKSIPKKDLISSYFEYCDKHNLIRIQTPELFKACDTLAVSKRVFGTSFIYQF